jgi:predicted amidophosphoribosyltransferase
VFFVARCPVCRRPGPSPCERCCGALTPPARSGAPALFAYEGTGRDLVHALKYRNGRSAVGAVGAAMAARAASYAPDVVTWAPTSSARRHARGYDQAELLARRVAAGLRCPCRRLLRRSDGAGPQTFRGRQERLRAPPTFVVARGVEGLAVLLVDDVVTTGATLRAAASALRSAGAARVAVLAAAATP